MIQLSHLEIANEVYRLAVQHEQSLALLGDIVTTFRLPANRVTIQKQLPELVPIIDSFIHSSLCSFLRGQIMNDNSPTKPRQENPRWYRVLKDVQLPHVGPGQTFRAGMLIELPPEYACKLLPGFLEPIRKRGSRA